MTMIVKISHVLHIIIVGNSIVCPYGNAHWWAGTTPTNSRTLCTCTGDSQTATWPTQTDLHSRVETDNTPYNNSSYTSSSVQSRHVLVLIIANISTVTWTTPPTYRYCTLSCRVHYCNDNGHGLGKTKGIRMVWCGVQRHVDTVFV